jgi:predicted DNA-binding transcriptional regulator YafY
MGSMSEATTLARVLVAFLQQVTWSQAALAVELNLQPRTVKKHLEALEAAGVPFEVERDHPHVYWSVARDWFPSGVLLTQSNVESIARLLARLPRSTARESAMRRLLEALPRDVPVAPQDREDPVSPEVLNVLEEALVRRTPLRARYFSAHRGDSEDRALSIHRFQYGRHPRFVATCHRSRTLKWFRADRVERASLASDEPFLDPPEDLERWLAESVEGYRSAGPAERHACFVRDPEARWVKRAAPEGARVEPAPGGVRLVWHAAALEPLARFVVGLGEAARAETDALRAHVRALALGALAGSEPAPLGDVRAPTFKPNG